MILVAALLPLLVYKYTQAGHSEQLVPFESTQRYKHSVFEIKYKKRRTAPAGKRLRGTGARRQPRQCSRVELRMVVDMSVITSDERPGRDRSGPDGIDRKCEAGQQENGNGRRMGR